MSTCEGDCEAIPAGEYDVQSGLGHVRVHMKHGSIRPWGNRKGAAHIVIRDPGSRDELGGLSCVAYGAEVRPGRFLLDGTEGSRIVEIRVAE